jgi:hypothetical protein
LVITRLRFGATDAIESRTSRDLLQL